METDEEAEEKRREAKRQARLERAAKKDLKLLSFGDEEEEEDDKPGRSADAWGCPPSPVSALEAAAAAPHDVPWPLLVVVLQW